MGVGFDEGDLDPGFPQLEIAGAGGATVAGADDDHARAGLGDGWGGKDGAGAQAKRGGGGSDQELAAVHGGSLVIFPLTLLPWAGEGLG
jgi:hypothetical protein